jgi:hypothetical protein
MNRCRRAICLLGLATSLVALTTACAQLESEDDKPFFGEDEILYGPESKPATVDCDESDALDDVRDYYDFDHVWSCEIVFKDGSGRAITCFASGNAPGSGYGSLHKTCEEMAEELRSSR